MSPTTHPTMPAAARGGGADAQIVRNRASTSRPRPPRRWAWVIGLAVLVVAVTACGQLEPVSFTRESTTTSERPPIVAEEQLPDVSLPTLRPARYEVQPGDTIGSIATKFGLTMDSLLAANNLTDPNRLEAGTVLRIPGPNATTPPPWLQRDSRDSRRGR